MLVRVKRRKVFVKRVPLTVQEYAEPFATRNLSGVPGFFNYGIGSMGSNAWRELAAATQATEWVLDGRCEGFAMLLHHRVVTRSRRAAAPAGKWLDDYVCYWGSSPRIRKRVVERITGPAELLLFFEYFPAVWADDHRSDLSNVVTGAAEVARIVEFLGAHGMTHFDAHPHNVMRDAQRYYLTDFGLALDRQFDLAASEHRFLDRHRHYDQANVVARVVGFLIRRFETASVGQQAAVFRHLGIHALTDRSTLQGLLVDQIEAVTDILGLSDAYREWVIRYRDVIKLMTRFDRAMVKSPG
ncbi:MAG: hypothetical protein AAF513_20725 [Pseudomonadota bacterium]